MNIDQTKLLVGASKSISEKVIRRHIAEFPQSLGGRISYVDGNPALHKVVRENWPDALPIAAKSPIAARKAIAHIDHLILLWDGTDLSSLLFEARLQRKKTKLIPIQVTKVVNKKITDDFDVYIGRGSPWGNPYAIGHGDGPDRKEVIEKYKEYFAEKISSDEGFKRGVLAMRGLRLACFCKPDACHGDVIADYLDSLSETPDQEDSDS